MKNPFSKFKLETRRGYTLLFSVIVSVLVLSVAAFILSISRKQFILSSSARDSMYAFYTADSGVECGVENQALLSTTSIATSATIPLSCGGKNLTATRVTGAAAGGATTTWQMSIPDGSPTCAIVSVWFYTSNPDGTGSVNYFVDARGYNIGWNATANTCNGYGPRRVERALRYSLNF
jgi:Tfp pilus assembly protein PilE